MQITFNTNKTYFNLSKNKIAFAGPTSVLGGLKSDCVEFSGNVPKGENVGQIYEKIKDPLTGKIVKKKINVDIDVKENYDQIYYTLKNGDEIVGYVQLEEHVNIPEYNKFFLMTSDIPEFGIVGDRIILKYVSNQNQQKYAGIGELADKIAIERCHKLGIKPQILLQAAYNSHAAHYKRGMRYLYSDEKCNPNEIIKKIIEDTPEGEHCKTSDLYSMVAYMPPETIKKYEEELKDNPIMK